MPNRETKVERKVIGTAEIKNKDGDLLVRFCSEDNNGFWGSLYEKERIKYAMRNRRKQIPEYLRTGERPEGIKSMAIRLAIRNLIRR